MSEQGGSQAEFANYSKGLMQTIYSIDAARPDNWKTKSDETFNERVIDAVSEQLYAFGYIPSPEKDFVFVSPTAHTATHEKQMFQKDASTRTGNGRFIVGDISDVGVPMTERRMQVGNSLYTYDHMDADNLPIDDHSADMIWDRRGNIWHIAITNDVAKLEDTLDHYASKLKTNGSVVIDSAPLDAQVRSSTHEVSTKEQINRMARATDVWNSINDKFKVTELGRGVTSIMVLEPKPRAV